MSEPTDEMERWIKVRALPQDRWTMEATAAERQALAKRFNVSAIQLLTARLTFSETDAGILAQGRLAAEVKQPCAVTREDFAYAVDEPVALLFVPEGQFTRYDQDEEIELAGEAPDEVEYVGDAFDAGEAIAQTLGLAIDPYHVGPDADERREEAGIERDDAPAPSGPLAEALAGLKRN